MCITRLRETCSLFLFIGVHMPRDGFRERGTLGYLSFRGPKQV